MTEEENKALRNDETELEKAANLRTRVGLRHDDDISLEGTLHVLLDCIETLSHSVKELDTEINQLKEHIGDKDQ